MYIRLSSKVILRDEGAFHHSAGHIVVLPGKGVWQVDEHAFRVLEFLCVPRSLAEAGEYYHQLLSTNGDSKDPDGWRDFVEFTVVNRIIEVPDMFCIRTAAPVPPPVGPVLGGKFLVCPASFPYTVQVAVTASCNLCCRHCQVSSGGPRQTKDELTTEQLCDLLSELDRSGTVSVGLTGGEPFARSDMGEVLGHAAKLRYDLSVLTNLTLLNDELAELTRRISAERGLGFGIGTSLDGATPAVHDRVRGKEGAFDNTTRWVRELTQTGVRVTVQCTLFRSTMHEMEGVAPLALDLGAREIEYIVPCVLGRAQRYLEDLPLTPDELLTIRATVQKLQTVYGADRVLLDDLSARSLLCSDASPTRDSHQGSQGTRRGLPPNCCGAGMTLLAIGPTGMVYPCSQSQAAQHLAMGNVCDSTLLDIWHSEQWYPYRGGYQFEDLAACHDCRIYSRCPTRKCRAYAAASLHDFYAPLPECIINAQYLGLDPHKIAPMRARLYALQEGDR